MKYALRSDEILLSKMHPEIQPITSIALEAADCIIVCAGFEDRALAFVGNTLTCDESCTVAIIGYLPYVAENRDEELRATCMKSGLHIVDISYDRENPVGFADKFLESIVGVQGRIFLDVSAMSRLLIVQAIVALASRQRGLADCYVLYAEAERYPPTLAEVENELQKAAEDPMRSILLLSSGVFEISVVPELSATSIGGGQSRLIAFPTYSADQLTALLNELGPTRLTLIHGYPPHPENLWRIDAVKQINQLDNLKYDEIVSSTLDYRETLRELLALYAKYAERERLVLSPTGSKMQSVAVGIFRSFISDVQIVYPTPIQYCSPRNYTEGIAQRYLLSLCYLGESEHKAV